MESDDSDDDDEFDIHGATFPPLQVCRSSYHLCYDTHSWIDLYRIIRHDSKKRHGWIFAEELAEERRARGVKLLPRKRKAAATETTHRRSTRTAECYTYLQVSVTFGRLCFWVLLEMEVVSESKSCVCQIKFVPFGLGQ